MLFRSLEFPLSVLESAPRNSLVVDPFYGRGTTAYAARYLGLRSYGIDSSPLAVAIARAKLTASSVTRVMALAEKLLDRSASYKTPLSFSKQHPLQDPARERAAVTTYATKLRQELARSVAELTQQETAPAGGIREVVRDETTDDAGPDVFELTKRRAFSKVQTDADFVRQLDAGGIPWFVVIKKIEQALPGTLHDRNSVAAGLVVEAMNSILGKQKHAWDAELRDLPSGKRVRIIFKL